MIDLTTLKPEIERVCRELPVKHPGVFGSALTGEFGPASDIDILVVFDAHNSVDLFDKYFDLKECLEKVFDREVDLIVDKPFRHPVFKNSVEKTKVVVYERRDT